MSSYIRKNNPENEKDYDFKEYPEDSPKLVDIAVEFKKPTSNGDKILLIVSFVKYISQDKIADFQIIDHDFP